MKGVTNFADLLRAGLAVESPETSVLFGAKFISTRDGQGTPSANRVVVVPHRLDGTRGRFLPARHAHRVPPDLGVHRRWVTIECWAFDHAEPTETDAQDDALELLVQAVWRTTQRIMRAPGDGGSHAGYPGDVPGYYNVEETTPVAPTERVVGAKAVLVFEIDFAVRELQPTTVDEPDLAITPQLESA